MADVPFVWPLNGGTTPDEMNTSFGPRIDANRWDFHDGIDLPAPVGTPVHAMADGVVHRAGPADSLGGKGFGSTHLIVKVADPTDTQKDLYLVYLHLDRIASGVVPDKQVRQGDVIGAVGQEDAMYPHLHFEFRKGRQASRTAVTRCTTFRIRTPPTSALLDWTVATSPAPTAETDQYESDSTSPTVAKATFQASMCS